GESSLLTAAASVIGIGTDLGGSIRIPALFSGIFGHKPSAGAVSSENQYPVVNDGVRQMISTGPMCRYAVDLLPMMKVLSGDKREMLRLDEPANGNGLWLVRIIGPPITRLSPKRSQNLTSPQKKPTASDRPSSLLREFF
ncbi:Fatty-acid amide hydrolase 2, partial [Araneus ventricosus]